MTRTDILNALIRKCGYTCYLEIGVQYGHNFNAIQCPMKIGVDPKPLFSDNRVYQVSSDEFFTKIHNRKSSIQYDLIFIDGLHHADQVLRDFENSLKVLSPNGTIVMHDCNPPSELHQQVPRPPRSKTKQWNGDVWKAWVEILRVNNHNISGFTIDTDFGVGIFSFHSKIKSPNIQHPTSNIQHPDYSLLEANRSKLLNLITPEQFSEIVK